MKTMMMEELGKAADNNRGVYIDKEFNGKTDNISGRLVNVIEDTDGIMLECANDPFMSSVFIWTNDDVDVQDEDTFCCQGNGVLTYITLL